MNQSVRIATTLTLFGALAAGTAGCGSGGGDDPGERPSPTASQSPPSPADDAGQAGSYHFPEIRSLVGHSSGATFTAEYEATVPGWEVTGVTLIRQAPVTVLLMDQARLIWTEDDTYVCQAAEQQCLRQGAPSANEDPRTGPDRDWAAILDDAGFGSLSPVASWEFLEGLRGDGTEVAESTQEIAGQASSCVELTNEAAQLEWRGTATACFLDNGVISRYIITLEGAEGSSEVAVELTGYSETVDAGTVQVPEDAQVQG